MTSAEKRKQAKSSQREIFRINPVAVGCTLLMLASGAYAQEAAKPAAATEKLDAVVVTGIRKGIEDAISVKRNSDSIVESISAEDIGKLPDASVAESISRLPGVTAQRSSVTGRAQGISVRGMPQDFTGGLLNGREQASTGSSRGVEFDQYPAELLGGIVVYKTPDAGLVGQGLSATIDMQTVRPLSFGQRNVVLNYRRESNTKAEDLPGFGAGTGDRASLSYIDQFADRTIGVAIGLTKQKSKGGGRPNFNTWGGWVADSCPGVVDSAGKCSVATVKTPGGFTTDIETTDFDRTGAMAVLQYKPNKNFESVVDVFYSKGDFSVKKRGLEGPVGGLSAGANDSGGSLINATISNGVATSGTFTNWKGVIRNHNEDYTDKLESIGWANNLTVGGWAFKSDLSYSKVVKDSTRYETTAGLPGNTANAADTISFSGFDGTNLSAVQYKTGLNYADPNIIKLTDVQGWAGDKGVQDGYYANPKTTDKIQAIRLSAKRDLEFGPITSVDFGGNYSDRTKDRVTQEGALVIKGGLNADGTVKDRLISTAMPNATTGVGGLTGIPTLNWDPAGSLGSVYELNPWSDHDIVGKSWGVQEKVTTAYVKGDIDTHVGSVNVRGNVGVQFQDTKQSSYGYRVDQASCDGGTHKCSYAQVGSSHNFTDFMPSLNLSADLGGDHVLRFGLGRVIARPNMEDMKGTIDFGLKTDVTPQRLNGSGGNGNLEPFRADAIDVSFEKYFGKKGYFSVAAFQKNLKTYILKVDRVFDFAPYLTPSTTLPPSGSTVGLLTTPMNGTGGQITGVEFAVNIPLNMVANFLDGFGVALNYSNTDSTVQLPASAFATQNVSTKNIPLPGLSKEVTNFRLYYEKYGFQVAVATRTRSDFLGSIADYQDKSQLVYIKGDTTVDLQASYEFSEGWLKGLSILAQGSNLTNSEYVNYDAGNGNVTDRKKFGKTYMLGVNYKF
ncbi:TonB-dependent receptor [Paucibacter sp. KBW04]|nr:TonB-dependent receptor [Paucibacter sp. KBW04]